MPAVQVRSITDAHLSQPRPIHPTPIHQPPRHPNVSHADVSRVGVSHIGVSLMQQPRNRRPSRTPSPVIRYEQPSAPPRLLPRTPAPVSTPRYPSAPPCAAAPPVLGSMAQAVTAFGCHSSRLGPVSPYLAHLRPFCSGGQVTGRPRRHQPPGGRGRGYAGPLPQPPT